MKAAPKLTPTRARWEVRPIRGVIGWVVTRNGFEKCRFFFKYRAVAFAVSECEYDLDRWGIPGELTIKGRNGAIQDKRTYGDDPREVLG